MSSCSGRKNNSIQQGNAEAKGCTACERFHQPTCRGPVQKQFVAHANVICGHNDRETFRDERDMANKCLIKNSVDRLAVITRTVRFTGDSGLVCRCELIPCAL